jgi:capsule polysaccharide export protein KpsE/RkpR
MTPAIDLSFLRDRGSRRRVATITMVFAVLGGVLGFASPKWYQSVVTVVPARSQKSGGMLSLLGGDLGALAGSVDSSLGGGADAARIAAVLQGTAVTDAVIEKFDLRARYGMKSQEDARDTVWRHCSVRTQPKPNTVQLTCEDKDPRFVQEMVAYFAGYGNEVFRRVNVSSASEEARYLEKRVAELQQQADETAARMREFQERHKIVDLDSQARAVVSSVAALNTQRRSKQMELEYARTFSAPDEAGMRQLESQLSVVDENLRDLERPRESARAREPQGRPARELQSGMFPTALAVPKLRAEYEKLFRDRKLAEATLVLTLDRLEGAKAAEARDVSTFVVLDPPTLPTRKSRPSRAGYVLGGAFLGFVASMAFSWWRARKTASPVAS